VNFKQFQFRSETREKVLRGATALADAVHVTLAPKSNVLGDRRKAMLDDIAMGNTLFIVIEPQ